MTESRWAMGAVEAPKVFLHPETDTVYRRTEPFYRNTDPLDIRPWTVVDSNGLTGTAAWLPPGAVQLVPTGPLRKLAVECSADSILTAAWAGDALAELLDTLTGGTDEPIDDTYVTRAHDALLGAMDERGIDHRIQSVRYYVHLYVLLVLTVGEECRIEDVHNAWMAGRYREPELRDPDRYVIPFHQLTDDFTKVYIPLRDAIQAATKAIS